VETRNHTDFNEINQRTVAGNNALLAHDKNGNTTDTGAFGASFPGSGLKLEWDALNRLRKVHKWDPASFSYQLVAECAYDCHNRRMRKVVTNSGSLNGTTDFYYEGWRVVEERDGADAVTQQYVYGNYLDEVWTLDNRRGGITVAQLNDGSGNQRHFYHSNTLYHVYGITDEAGAIKEAYQYDAYGKQTVITDGNDADTIVNFNADDVRTVSGNSTLNNFHMYTGQRFDSESGIFYFKSRYMAASLGRFLSRDPWRGVDPRSNRYQYVVSNPVMGTDIYGLVTKKECEDFALKVFNATMAKDSLHPVIVDYKNAEGGDESGKKRKCSFAIRCVECGPGSTLGTCGTYKPPNNETIPPSETVCDLKICYDRASDMQQLAETIYHELIHCSQKCRKAPYNNNCANCMCSEYQAAMNDGGCDPTGTFMKKGGYKTKEECGKASAKRSCKSVNLCSDDAAGEKALEPNAKKCSVLGPIQ
jgi:RHS repeat-associated protein